MINFLKKKINKNFNLTKNIKNVNINFGPQHPAAHGVLRLLLNLENEKINFCDPHIGLLHRGTEKLMENKIYLLSLPHFDRLDYVSTIVQENVYCLALDKLRGSGKNSITTHTRTIFDELTRILNHLLAISCHALDVGSMSTIFWSFEEREKIMEFYERFTGARMHTALYKPFLFKKIINNKLKNDILFFCKNFFITINEIHNVLTLNKVWKTRLINNGFFSLKKAINFNITGPMARSTGLKKDIRLDLYKSYNNYKNLNFFSYYTSNGDSYDRYLIRMMEMVESINIVNQSLNLLNYLNIKKTTQINNFFKNKNMETIIDHFKYWSSGFNLKSNFISTCVESPKGEFYINLFSDSSEKPYRCKIKSPSYNHLQFLKNISKNIFLADIVTLIGTIDIVFGEIDR